MPDKERNLYVYNRELIMPLIVAAGLAQPVLRMDANDAVTAQQHIRDGAWSSRLNEEALPQFQQDPAHLRFCDQEFLDDDQ